MINNSTASAIAALALLASCGNRQTQTGYQGVIELDEQVLAFEIGGKLDAVNVERGDRVERAAVLATLDAGLERAVLAAREAEARAARSQVELLRAGARTEDIRSLASRVRAARANETLLEKNLAREKALLAKDVSTQAAVDQLEASLASTRAERESIEHTLRSLKSGSRPQEILSAEARAEAASQVVSLEGERLRRHELRAVSAGQVLDVHVEPGEVVSPGAPVVTIGDTTHPYADVFVPQDRLDGIRLGIPALVRIDASPAAFPGRVESIAQRTEFTPRFLFSERERPNLVVRVRVRLDDPQERLHAGVPAFVTLQAGETADESSGN